MSIKISTDENDELNIVFLKPIHPLKTLENDNSKDDVLYLHMPNAMLKGTIRDLQEALEANKDSYVLFSGDIKLRHQLIYSIADKK